MLNMKDAMVLTCSDRFLFRYPFLAKGLEGRGRNYSHPPPLPKIRTYIYTPACVKIDYAAIPPSRKAVP